MCFKFLWIWDLYKLEIFTVQSTYILKDLAENRVACNIGTFREPDVRKDLEFV